MYLLGIFIVSPLWGMLSTQLFFQSLLTAVGIPIALLGLIVGRVESRDNLLVLGVHLVQLIIFGLLLSLGYFVLDLLSFGYTSTENTVYWIFAAITVVYSLIQIPAKLKRAWLTSMQDGYLEEVTKERRRVKDQEELAAVKNMSRAEFEQWALKTSEHMVKQLNTNASRDK